MSTLTTIAVAAVGSMIGSLAVHGIGMFIRHCRMADINDIMTSDVWSQARYMQRHYPSAGRKTNA